MSVPDLSEFEALSAPKKKRCSLHDLSTIKPAERVQLIAALEQPADVINNVAIVKWLALRGIHTKWQQVSVHRDGTCSCARS